MIVVDQKPQRVSVSVFGEFTLADYKEFEEVVNFKVRFEGPVDLYFDLSQMADLTIDVACSTSPQKSTPARLENITVL